MKPLKEKYKEVVVELKKEFGYKNDLAVPRIKKVVVNTGFGRLVASETGKAAEKIYKSITEDLALICAQRPVLTRAKNSISSFKIRKGMIIGAKVTLRGQKMYDLLDKLIHIVLPRTRDFVGIDKKGVDQEGNLTIGLREQIVFPEISSEKVRKIFGLQITVITNTNDKKEAEALFKHLGFPFKK